MKIVNADLSLLKDALNGKGIFYNPSAVHRMQVASRKRKVEKKIMEIAEALSPNQDYIDYEKERKRLFDTLFKKDPELFKKKIAELKEKYHLAIELNKNLVDDYNRNYLDKDSEINFAPIKLSDFKNKSIVNFYEILGLWPIIDLKGEHFLFKEAEPVMFKVKDIIGDIESGTESILSPDKISKLYEIKYWDLNVRLAFNVSAFVKKAREFRNDERYIKYQEDYEKKRQDLCEVNCRLDDFGDPVLDNGNYIIINPEEFNIGLGKLKKRKAYKDFKKFLDEDVEMSIIYFKDKLIEDFSKAIEDGDTDLSMEQSDILLMFMKED